MARINLLPWREELRRERNQNFYITTIVLGVLGLGIVFLMNMQVNAQLQAQLQRNQYIKTEQAALEQKIIEIDRLKQERAELESRMRIIQDLQGNRSVVVRLFDEIAKKTPDGVFLKKIDRVGTRFKIEGVAEANNRISNMMRNLEQSPWFENANLESVVSDDSKSSNTFDLVVQEEAARKKGSDNDAS